MELLNTLCNLMGLVFVLGTIASMGLSLTIAQITAHALDGAHEIKLLPFHHISNRIIPHLVVAVPAVPAPAPGFLRQGETVYTAAKQAGAGIISTRLLEPCIPRYQ